MTNLSKDQQAAVKAVVLREFLQPRNKGVSFVDYFAFRGRNAIQIVDQLQLPMAFIAAKEISGSGLLPDRETCNKVMRYTQTVLATQALLHANKSEVSPRTNMFVESEIALEGLYMPFRSRNFHSPVPSTAVDAATLLSNSVVSVWEWTYQQLVAFRETMSDIPVFPQSQGPREMWWSSRSVEQFEKVVQLDGYRIPWAKFDLNPRSHADDGATLSPQAGKIQKALTKAATPQKCEDIHKAMLLQWGVREFGFDGSLVEYEKHLHGIYEDPQRALASGLHPKELSLCEGIKEVVETGHTSFLCGWDVGGSGAIELALHNGVNGDKLARFADAGHPEYVDPKTLVAKFIRLMDVNRVFEGVTAQELRSQIAGEIASPVYYGGTETALTGALLGLDTDEDGNYILEKETGPVTPVPPACIAHRFEGMDPEEMIKSMRNMSTHFVKAVRKAFPFIEPTAKKTRIEWAKAMAEGMPPKAKTLLGLEHQFLPWRYDKSSTNSISTKWFQDHETGLLAQTQSELKDLLGLDWAEYNKRKGEILTIQNGVTSFKVSFNQTGGNYIAQKGQGGDAESMYGCVLESFEQEPGMCMQHCHDDMIVSVVDAERVQRNYTKQWNLKGAKLPENAISLRCFPVTS